MRSDTQTTRHKISIVAPIYNEAENVIQLVENIHQALCDFYLPWELILVNDGSTDQTLDSLRKAQQTYPEQVVVINLQKNFGQTAAMQAGIDYSRGHMIVTIDGDLQNDPQDIPRMVKRFIEEDLDLLAGRRLNRKDNFFLRTFPSRVANYLIGRVTGVRLHDYGCSLKIYRASIIKQIRLYGEMHRFIPAWLATVTSRDKIAEEVVHHHPRQFGKSKYGLSRTFRILIDLLAVHFFMQFQAKPGHFFGAIGLVIGCIGSLMLSILAVDKFYYGEDIGTRPLLLIGILFIITSIQFLTTGILTELMARTYFEASNTKPYLIRDIYANKERISNT